MNKKGFQMRLLFALLLSSTAISSGYSDPLKNESELKTVIDNSIKLFSEEKFQNAVDLVKPYYPSSASSLDNFGLQFANQWTIYKSSYGPLTGIEFVQADRIGKSFIKLRYLFRFAVFAVRAEIVAYNGYNGWVISSYNIYDKVDDVFK